MPDQELGQARADELERQLWDGIVPYWSDHALDKVHGVWLRRKPSVSKFHLLRLRSQWRRNSVQGQAI